MSPQILSDKFFDKFDEEFPNVVTRLEANFYVEPIVQPKMVEVTLKGDSIVSILMGDGISKLVIFRPTAATHKAVKTFKDMCIDLSIEDSNGLFDPTRPQTIVDSIYESGNDTMIVTTENQE